MIKLGATVLVSSFLAGLAVTAPAPQVEAHSYAVSTNPSDARTYGPACSERGWPYFETKCLRDGSSTANQARTVRMVGTDRVPAPR